MNTSIMSSTDEVTMDKKFHAILFYAYA